MSFNNLRQLAALFKPPVTQVAESSAVQLANKLENAKLQLKDAFSEAELDSISQDPKLAEMKKSLKDMTKKFQLLSDSINEFSSIAKKALPIKEAKLSDMRSGYTKSRKALDVVASVTKGGEDLELPNGTTFTSAGSVLASRLKVGMTVLATYNSSNQGADLVEIMGVIVEQNDNKTTRQSVKEALAAIGVTSLKSVPGEYDIRLEVADVEDGDYGDWYYLYEGRFCRGSGAEPLSFTQMKHK